MHKHQHQQNSCIYDKINGVSRCIDIDQDELKNAVFETNDPNNPDNENGLITNIWGYHEWESFNAKTFGYPIKPTPEQKTNYLDYFISLGHVLPCRYCRESYILIINQGDTKLDMSVMESRETLTRWGWRVRNAVNEKIGVDYGETYEELCYKFNSYRAKCTKSEKGCKMPLDMKAKSYQKADIHRAPIIDKKYCLALIPYAKQRGIDNYEVFLTYYSSLVRNSKAWSYRDCTARKIIKHMRMEGISSLTEDDLPSDHEMLLISMLSSTLPKDMLDKIYDKVKNLSV